MGGAIVDQGLFSVRGTGIYLDDSTITFNFKYQVEKTDAGFLIATISGSDVPEKQLKIGTGDGQFSFLTFLDPWPAKLTPAGTFDIVYMNGRYNSPNSKPFDITFLRERIIIHPDLSLEFDNGGFPRPVKEYPYFVGYHKSMSQYLLSDGL